MIFYKDDFVIILSLFSRINQEKENLELFKLNDCAESEKEFFLDYFKKIISECTLIGLTDLLPFYYTLIKLIEIDDKNKTCEKKQTYFDLLIKQMFSLKDKIKTFIHDHNKSSDLQFDLQLLSNEDSSLLAEIDKLFLEPPCINANEYIIQQKYQNEFQLKTLMESVEPMVPHFINAIDNYFAFPDLDNYLIIIKLFDQLKGNIDLCIVSLDEELANNHPLMQMFSFCEKLDAFFDKTKRSDHILKEMTDIVVFSKDVFKQLFEFLISNNMGFTDFEEQLKVMDNLYNKIANPISININTIIINNNEKDNDPEILIEENLTPKNLSSEDNPVLKTEDYINIKQDYLEKMTNMISELMVTNSSLSYIQSQINNETSLLNLVQSLHNTEKMFFRIINELDQMIMTLRLQKVKDVFNRYPRMVRDLAKTQNKKIDFIMQGEDLELDNIILKQLADPIMHILRNSCDHGIESPEQRIAKGKNALGKIILKAEIISNKMLLEIFDDGKGIDPELIRKEVLKKELLSPSDLQKMDDKQVLKLIFLAGFSTAKKITDISGRGVGMDVVLQNVSKVKGEINVESEVDKYTRITIKVPLSISISKALRIQTGNDDYLIPLENIVSLVSLEKENIHAFQDAYFIKHQDQLIALRHLDDILNNKKTDLKQKYSLLVIILNVDFCLKALSVDKVHGIQELSIKMLPDNLKDLDIYRGCATLSDGRAILVLNPKKLF